MIFGFQKRKTLNKERRTKTRVSLDLKTQQSITII